MLTWYSSLRSIKIYDSYHDLFESSKSVQYNLKDMIILAFYMQVIFLILKYFEFEFWMWAKQYVVFLPQVHGIAVASNAKYGLYPQETYFQLPELIIYSI